MGNEKFVRWQGITIKQLTYAINLILGLSTASLGFAISLLLYDKFNPICNGKLFYITGTFLLFLSIILGILTVINRLINFRKTARIAKIRKENPDDPELIELEEKTDVLGNRTWNLFWLQIGFFGVGILFLIISISIVYHIKLF